MKTGTRRSNAFEEVMLGENALQDAIVINTKNGTQIIHRHNAGRLLHAAVDGDGMNSDLRN